MNKKGFTFAELIVAILMTAALIALAVPAVIGFLDNIVMTRLNTSAKGIFLSSQHEFIYRSGAGTLEQINDISAEKDGLKYLKVSQDNNFSQTLSALLSVADGTSAIIEYSPSSASIGAVFFSEKMTSSELETIYITENLYDPAVRRKLRIGYYGGDPVSKLPCEHMMTPKIAVVNREDLYLIITCDDIPSADFNSFDVEVVLKSALHSAALNAYMDDTYTARLLLDTMDDIPFAVRYPEFGLSDITAEVRIIYRGENGIEMTSDKTMSETAVTFNPLFENVDGNRITVSRVRHLNNLRYINTQYVTVSQSRDIAFKDVPETEFYIPRIRNLQISPLPEFAGIFDGSDHLITNISLDTYGDVTGLFRQVSGELKNIHLTGSAMISSSAETVGTLCGRLTTTGRITNCSASEITVESGDGSIVGGLAGICEGTITNSSAILDDIRLGANCTYGGIAGKLSGSISFSHSAGKVTSSAGSLICGISSGTGRISNCCSECTAGYVSDSEFYGVSADADTRDSAYVLENAWLALDTDRAEERATISISGFTPPRRAVIDSVPSPVYALFPESVTQNGVSTRFGALFTPEPRGLIGILEVTYDGEGYTYDLIHSFDAYGNDSVNCPAITWDDPHAGETRVYVFRSKSAYPEGGEAGWEWTTDGEFSAEELHDNYICRQILDAELVTLRFGSIVKTAEFDSEESPSEEEAPEGIVGVVAVLRYDFIIDMDTWDIVDHLANYSYIDFKTEQISSYEFGGLYGNSGKLQELSDLTFETSNFFEVRIYLFSSSSLKFGRDWSGQYPDITYDFDYEGYTMHEIFRGDSFDPISIDIKLSNGAEMNVSVDLDSSGGMYSTPRIAVLN